MSDIKKIKDEFLLKLNGNLDLNQINEIKSELFGKNGLISSQFKKLSSVAESDRKIFASDLNTAKEELQSKILQKIQDIETKEINQKLEKENYQLVDCQVYNNHLDSLGACEISRNEFLTYLKP